MSCRSPPPVTTRPPYRVVLISRGCAQLGNFCPQLMQGLSKGLLLVPETGARALGIAAPSRRLLLAIARFCEIALQPLNLGMCLQQNEKAPSDTPPPPTKKTPRTYVLELSADVAVETNGHGVFCCIECHAVFGDALGVVLDVGQVGRGEPQLHGALAARQRLLHQPLFQVQPLGLEALHVP